MKIFLPMNSWLYTIMLHSYPYWREMGVEVFYDLLTWGQVDYLRRRFQQSGTVLPHSVHPSSLYKSWWKIDISDANIARLERKYGVRLNELVIYDLALVKYHAISPQRVRTEEYWRRYFVGTVEYYEELLPKVKPDYVFGEGPHGCGMKVLFAVSRSMGIPFYTVCGGYTEESVYFGYGRQARNPALEYYYENPHLLDEADYVQGKELMHRIRSSPKPANLQGGFPETVQLLPRSLSSLSKVARESVNSLRSVRDPIKASLGCKYNPLWTPLAHRFRNWKNFRDLTARCEPPARNGILAVFFCHYQPEATTSVWSPYFEDQDTIVENIAKSLLGSMQFGIKEHYACLGLRGPDYFQDSLRYPGVYLVDPRLRGRDLAGRASVVFTISGTIGMESLLMGKPVAIFSDCYYSFYPGVKSVHAPEELPRVIKWALEDFKPDEMLMQRFAAAYAKSIYRMRLMADNFEDEVFLSKEETLRIFVNAICEFVNSATRYGWSEKMLSEAG